MRLWKILTLDHGTWTLSYKRSQVLAFSSELTVPILYATNHKQSSPPYMRMILTCHLFVSYSPSCLSTHHLDTLNASWGKDHDLNFSRWCPSLAECIIYELKDTFDRNSRGLYLYTFQYPTNW